MTNDLKTQEREFDYQAYALEAIKDNPKLAKSTKHQYTKAIKNYLATGESMTDPKALTEYAGTVGSATKSYLKAYMKMY